MIHITRTFDPEGKACIALALQQPQAVRTTDNDLLPGAYLDSRSARQLAHLLLYWAEAVEVEPVVEPQPDPAPNLTPDGPPATIQ